MFGFTWLLNQRLWGACVGVAILVSTPSAQAASPYLRTIQEVQPKIVKIQGVGGFQGLEPYQSGFLISAQGHVLTIWSYVLDTEYITVTLDDGRKFDAKLVAADPRLELAVLKIEAENLPFFDLSKAAEASMGTRVLAFSNIFGIATGNESASVQHGSVSARGKLQARRGVYETPYNGQAYILDAVTNNPGAAGGALTNERGELLGMLGKELRNSLNNIWLNYAIPVADMRQTVDDIMAGKFEAHHSADTQVKPKEPMKLDMVGIILVPDILERTPSYVDTIRPDSPAAKAGVRPDDLVLFVNDRLVQSCKNLKSELEYIDRADKIKLTLLRDHELIDITLSAPAQP